MPADLTRCRKCGRQAAAHSCYERTRDPCEEGLEGLVILRYYCRPCRLTISLLPSFLATWRSYTLEALRGPTTAHVVEGQSLLRAAAESRLNGAQVGRFVDYLGDHLETGERAVTSALAEMAPSLEPHRDPRLGLRVGSPLRRACLQRLRRVLILAEHLRLVAHRAYPCSLLGGVLVVVFCALGIVPR